MQLQPPDITLTAPCAEELHYILMCLDRAILTLLEKVDAVCLPEKTGPAGRLPCVGRRKGKTAEEDGGVAGEAAGSSKTALSRSCGGNMEHNDDNNDELTPTLLRAAVP